MSNSQHIILEALTQEAWKAVEDGKLDDSVFVNEPVSHVFYPEPGEPWDEDDVASIKAVGDQDMHAKITYWTRVVDGIPR